MARPKLGETETERMQLKITTAEIEAIDDWRFANRVPSRSEAVRRLCQIALQTENMVTENAKEALWVLESIEAIPEEKGLLSAPITNWVNNNFRVLTRIVAASIEISELMKALRSGGSVEEAITATNARRAAIESDFKSAREEGK